MRATDELDVQQGQRNTTRHEDRHIRENGSISGDDNSDEKKENEFSSGSANSQLVADEASSWNLRDADVSYYRSHDVSPIGTPRNHNNDGVQSSNSFSSLEDQEIGTNISAGSVTGNGLHHRHSNHQLHTTASPPEGSVTSQDKLLTAQMSPARRRRARRQFGASSIENPFRRRKWTAVQVFRVLLLSGIGFYFLAMIRTLFLMQHTDRNNKDDIRQANPSTRSYWRDIINHHYATQPDVQGYLRSGSDSTSLPPMVAPVVDKVTQNDPVLMSRVLDKRFSERRARTRPPHTRPQGYEINQYDILPLDQQLDSHVATNTRNALRKASSATVFHDSQMANVTQICGSQARQAFRESPNSFLQNDVLIDSGARVLITGILSNPLAYHLALTLKAQCGVEVLIGIDAMLPNTVRSRLQFLEQMKILVSNAPKMVQPILVPLLGLDPRVKKNKKEANKEQPNMLQITGELDLMNFQPTHIVHLASASFHSPRGLETATKYPYAPKQPLSPYQISEADSYEPSLFQLRSSLLGMEQLLASITENAGKGENLPHVTYASSTTSTQRKRLKRDSTVHVNAKVADEILAETYHSLFGIYSVGVRIPPDAVYGPWHHVGSEIYQVLERALQGNISAYEGYTEARELIYVQDAVESVLTAMQYRADQATSFEVSANAVAPLSEVASTALALSTGASARTLAPEIGSPVIQTHLSWHPQLSLREGLLRTLAWHIDRDRPFGPPGGWDKNSLPEVKQEPQTGDDLLLKNAIKTCPADDLVCHAGSSYLPCASECSTRAQCRASIFDPVRELARNMTEGCDALLYTQSLGLDIEDLQLQSQFEDDVEPAICNLAFVAQSSPLVKAVIKKIPKEELVRLGVPATADFDMQLNKLNGRLLYRGWILIWVDRGETVPPTDLSLVKLSPGQMFSSDVLYAVFVEENFTVSPTPDDVRFLISQMDRGATKQRSIWRMIKSDDSPKEKKVKFIVPAENAKRASMLVSQLKYKISDRSRISQDAKISVMDAVRFMRFEIGLNPTKQKESPTVKLQREFYKRSPTFANGKELRDGVEPMYKYELKHWVRTRWVVHDLTLEESRDLRCSWYQEHVQWGSKLDQLSLAATMAQKEIERRIANGELDDRSKPQNAIIPELRDVTDTNEWFAMETERNKQHMQHQIGVVTTDGEETPSEEDEPGVEDGEDSTIAPEKKKDADLYVRIISDRIMSLSRKAYARYRLEMSQSAGH